MKKAMQSMAMFMICLVVFIPFYVSDTYAAASLTIRKISGMDGVDEFARPIDILTINVEASLDGEAVEPTMLRAYRSGASGYSNFQSCSDSGDGVVFLCNYSTQLFGIFDNFSYKVGLFTPLTQYDDFADPAASASKPVKIDLEEAEIVSIEAVPERSLDGTTTIVYSAEDFGIDETDKEQCSGVAMIEFYEDDYSGNLFEIVYPDDFECDFNGSIPYDTEGQEGKFTICAKAYDQLGQTRVETKCADFFMDNTGPEADLASLKITKAGTSEEIKFIGQQPIQADITVAITAPDLVVNSVYADLSNIAGAQYTKVPFAVHSPYNNTHFLTWTNFPIGPIETCSITVYARDELGNNASTLIPCNIKPDTKGPKINKLTTPSIKGDVYYLGRSTTIIGSITEEGIGLNNRQIYLDLTNINGKDRVQPDNCTQIEGSNWACLWNDVTPTAADGEYFASVKRESFDDLDNPMEEKYDQKLGVDKTSPEINQNVSLTVIPGITDVPYQNLTLSGDTIEFIVAVSDAYSATADFSSIGGIPDALPVECWRENETTYCRWETSVMASGPYDADITFEFTDFAGNSNRISKEIFVSGTLDERFPDYWDSEVRCSPVNLDRTVASLINHPAYCHIHLEPKGNPAAITQSISMAEFPSRCYFDDNTTSVTDYVAFATLTNNYPEGVDPYMQLVMQTGDFLINSIEFKCELEIFTEINDEYTTNPEIEEVEFSFGFYDLPAGQVDDNYEDDIEDAEESVEWIADWVTETENFFELSRDICEIYGALNTALAGISALAAIFGITSKAAGGSSNSYGQALQNIWLGFCQGDDKGKKGVMKLKSEAMDKYCSFVNCKYSKAVLDKIKNKVGAYRNPAVQQASAAGFSVKDSIIWSLATLCVPGILFNLNKYKQITCQWLVCMVRDVPSGVPKWVCDDVKGYMDCVFLWSQIFNALPFLQLYSNAMTELMEAWSDPLALLGWVAGVLGCNRYCKPGSQTASTGCVTLGILSMIGDAYGEIMEMAEDDYWDTLSGGLGGNATTTDWCAEYEDVKEDLEDEE